MTFVLFSLAAFTATLAGGLFALHRHKKLHALLSFAAGVLLGVVAFELLPEIFHLSETLGAPPERAMLALVIGFLLFHSLEKFVLLHHAHEDSYAHHHHPKVGILSSLALIGHSFVDGLGMGVGFHLSTETGIAVAIAVIAHDFCDGLNTVSLMLMHKNTRQRALLMLLADATAPLMGAAVGYFWPPPDTFLPAALGFFAGFLLYIGAADILPEAHSKASPREAIKLVVLTTLGALLVCAVSHGAGH